MERRLWPLPVAMARCSLKQACAKQEERRRVGPLGRAFARLHTSYVLELISQMAKQRSWRYEVHRSTFTGLKRAGGVGQPPQFANALAVHHILNTRPHLTIRFSIYMTRVPSFGGAGASYILNTPPHLAIPVHHMSQTRVFAVHHTC